MLQVCSLSLSLSVGLSAYRLAEHALLPMI